MMTPMFSFEHLHRQYLRCRRNKRTTHNALRFEAQLEENLMQLHEELEGRTYCPSRSVCFVVKQPKYREIFAADFRDRVVHHVLVEALERVWEPIFLHDSYACRKGKGTHRAVTSPPLMSPPHPALFPSKGGEEKGAGVVIREER